MSERVTDQIIALVRRLTRHLNRKASAILLLLFNNKSAGSLGAIAGFAIAVVFTWKFLRAPQGGQRRSRPKRRNPASLGGSEGCETGGLKDSDAIEGTGSSVELTLEQIVRRKLGGCGKMTCQVLGVILEERTPEELQKHATVRPSIVEVLLQITKFCDLYLMETVLDDESEERVLSALESAGLFQTGGLVKDKVLFCSTEIGRSSFVRQLESSWHVDTNLEIVSQLARFIKYLLLITPEISGQMAPNVFTSTSLEHYLSCP